MRLKQIQLDAMKEGMRRTAELTNDGIASDKYAQAGMKMCAKAILTAADKLKIDDV